MQRTGRVCQDQSLDPGSREEHDAGCDLLRAITLVKMNPALSENDPGLADPAEHETAEVSFDAGARQIRDFLVRNRRAQRGGFSTSELSPEPSTIATCAPYSRTRSIAKSSTR